MVADNKIVTRVAEHVTLSYMMHPVKCALYPSTVYARASGDSIQRVCTLHVSTPSDLGGAWSDCAQYVA